MRALRALDSRMLVATVVLVEGISDQLALEALAARRGRKLDAEGISVVAMGGAHNIASFLDLFGPQGLDVGLAGLCDAGEETALVFDRR
jgi:predicted ATP-dependent endonuclease of OLD family